MTFSGTQKPTHPTVFKFNLQASDWVHCEEETSAYYQLPQFTFKFVKKNNTFLKLFNCAKKYALFKKFPKIYYSFFQKQIIGWAYI